MAEPLRKTVPVGGADLDVLVGGRDEPGALTVCTTHPYSSMHDALPLLAEITRARVVCMNTRGVGRSSPPQHATAATLESMADDLDAVRQALSIPRWVIWGMSGGGMIAQVYAHRHPEGLEALILDSAGPCFAETLRDPDCVASPFFPKWREALAAAGLAADTKSVAGSGALVNDVTWQEVSGIGWTLRRRLGPALLVSPDEPSPEMRRGVPFLLTFDARPWLSAVTVPTLVLSGTADQVAPTAQLRALHEAIPGATFAVIEGGGHVPVFGDKSAEVAAVVKRFLSQRVRL
jgi:3-oxoadipate enol-lactonase